MKRALFVIDVQNEYFDGQLPISYPPREQTLPRILQATRWDVGLSMLVAGAVNIAMLLLAAASLQGVAGTDSIEGAHAAITDALGPAFGVLFGIGLLASGRVRPVDDRTVPLSALPDEIARLADDPTRAVKVLVDPSGLR